MNPVVLVLVAAALFAVSGLPPLFFRGRAPLGDWLASTFVVSGGAVGLLGTILALSSPSPPSLAFTWAVAFGRCGVAIDPISALFLLPICIVSPLASVYSLEYWPTATSPSTGRKMRFFYGLVTASLALMVIATNTILFLYAWEGMAIAAFMLVTTDDADADVRTSGLVYLALAHLGTLSLFGMFALLHQATGTFDFCIPAGGVIGARVANGIFVLAVLGFGIKAGLMPMHFWLPGAHASAPSHVSALMSGVLLKMGIYGLVRVTSFFPHPPAIWGISLLALGGISGVLGIAHANVQKDIKRLLAYSSVDNIGIITMGLGLALLGRALHHPLLVVLGMAGALFHVLNHSLFKSLLFLSTGSLTHATGTRIIDKMGGITNDLPRTSLGFLVGSLAACGLPPLNGFASEYLIYIGLFHAVSDHAGDTWFAGATFAPVLALIGALSVACFVNVFGMVFLGGPREPPAHPLHEPGSAMLVPIALLALACGLVGFLPFLLVPLLEQAARAWGGEDALGASVRGATSLGWIGTASALLAIATFVLAQLQNPKVRTQGTWDCGYADPSARMQYTSSSFGDSLAAFFAGALRRPPSAPVVRGPFPAPSRFESNIDDAVFDRIVLPSLRRIAHGFDALRKLERGSSQFYVFLVLVAVVSTLLATSAGGR